MKNVLYIIIPAYNEEMNIGIVAKEWHSIVTGINMDSKLIVIDDGSKDKTYKVLKELELELSQLKVITKPNTGHGATVLYGYNYAIEQGADYIFQTDSDGQTLPSEFQEFWHQRTEYLAIIGFRNNRQDGLSRVLVTKILKIVLWLVFGVWVVDANTPYRLLNSKIVEKYLPKIPKEFNLSNVILTLLFVKYEEKIKFIPITFKPRQGGVNSINLKKIVKIGKQAVKDFIQIKKQL